MRIPARIRELAAFGTVGAAAFVLHLAVFNVLVGAGVGPLTSNGCALVCATVLAFVGNRQLVFSGRNGGGIRREACIFFVINMATFALGEVVLSAAYLVDGEHNPLVVNTLNIAGIVLGTIARYVGYRRWVFRPGAGAPQPVALESRQWGWEDEEEAA